MDCTLNPPMFTFEGSEAAWQDTYALALGAAKPTMTIKACMAAARVALAAYGPGLHPHGAVFLDFELGPLAPLPL